MTHAAFWTAVDAILASKRRRLSTDRDRAVYRMTTPKDVAGWIISDRTLETQKG